MTPEQAALTVQAHLRAQFGYLLIVRPPQQRRRAAGPTWAVPVVAVCSRGEIPIAEVEVDEAGAMSPALDADLVIDALRASLPAEESAERGANAQPPEGFDDAEQLFADVTGDANETDPDVEVSSRRLRDIFRSTAADSLLEARKLLPRLLGDRQRRGRVLLMMAEVERRLGEDRVAMGYIDAGAHELADRFEITGLERAARMALSMGGGGPANLNAADRISGLIARCHTRMEPLKDVFESPVLARVPPEHRGTLLAHTRLVGLASGETLVEEGDRSLALFVVKSGILAVWHKTPVLRFVRCCSPGWLLGESSVLVAEDPRCTATLRAERTTEVWRIEASVARWAMGVAPGFREGILGTKAIHGLDSFFSAHGSVGQLDAEVRNEMLKCIQSIQTFPERTVVVFAGDPPPAPCLVARGNVSVYPGWETEGAPETVLGPDDFVGVRDALHRTPSSKTAVAEPGATVVFFDGSALCDLAQRSSEQAITVLERLG